MERAFTVALIGPDGAGKTTVARLLRHELEIPVKYLYMGVNGAASNHMLPTTRIVRAAKRALGKEANAGGPPPPEPGRTPPASPLKQGARTVLGTLRLLNQLGEEWYRQLIAWRHVNRGEVVVFDRHFFSDFWAHDIARTRLPVLRRVHGIVLDRYYPKPDLTILLDAPVEVLWSRKPEGTPFDLARRRREYHRLVELFDGVEVVDATLPPDLVARDVAEVIRRHALRSARDRVLVQA